MREIIAAILSELGYPFYFLQAEDAEEEEGTYICYDLYDFPALSGDGREARRRYTVTFHIYSRDEDRAEQALSELCAVLEENEFTRAGGSFEGDSEFPEYIRRSTDFYYDL